MQVRQGMSSVVLTIGPEHTLRAAAAQMAKREVGSAVVMDPESPGPGILTERDVLLAIGAGQDPDAERVRDHLSADVVTATPEWPLEQAATEMVRNGFRHLLVVEGGETVGVLSVRDIVRCWTEDGATSDMPRPAAAA